MTNEEIISSYGLLDIHEPMPEEIERAMNEARRLRARAFRDIARAAGALLARVFSGHEIQAADAHRDAKPACAA